MEDRAEEAVQEAKRRLVEGTEAVAGGARNLVAGRSIGRGGNVAEQAPLTALYTVLGTLVLAWLLTRVWAQRLRTKVFLSDGTLERIREATSSREEAEFVTPSLGPPDEDAISPVSPPPSPRPDRDHPAAVRSAAGVESTKVIYRRHSALSRRIESLGDYAKAFGPMVVLSLFAEASGLNRLVLHILWATWAVAQVLYHQYGRVRFASRNCRGADSDRGQGSKVPKIPTALDPVELRACK
ncbi:hypothetical protein DFJ74DRAFT_203771 [Hyaloraphidium curvatum]|nr:hypothetical protein DFJ74DRAFT_203771 [Hyaloraphidium curvatum]